MKIGEFDIGVCSWSLKQPTLVELFSVIQDQLGLSHCQLALGDLLAKGEQGVEEVKRLAEGITLTAAMIGFEGENYATIEHIKQTGGYVPDETWERRRQITLEAADFAAELGIKKISTHVGFVPRPNDPNYDTVLKRITELSKPLANLGLDLLMETGQEPAHELLQFLNDLRCKNFGVNFDPANMLLYGSGDPIEAVITLGRHIKHVHIKDGVRSARPGVDWGDEVPFGEGEVSHAAFIATLKKIGYTGPLVIEREAGESRVEDVRFAIETLKSIG
jgi:L-ribulose-5-phosphate 3-epimerase